jgi:hypothetical protein
VDDQQVTGEKTCRARFQMRHHRYRSITVVTELVCCFSAARSNGIRSNAIGAEMALTETANLPCGRAGRTVRPRSGASLRSRLGKGTELALPEGWHNATLTICLVGTGWKPGRPGESNDLDS